MLRIALCGISQLPKKYARDIGFLQNLQRKNREFFAACEGFIAYWIKRVTASPERERRRGLEHITD